MLDLRYRNARRRLQAPFRQCDIHCRRHVALVFKLHRQRLEYSIEGYALNLLTGNRPAAQLQLHKPIARIPIVTRRGNGVAARNVHGHNRQAIVSLKLPGSASAPAKRPNAKGNHQHGKHRKTNRDQSMVRTAFLGRYIPLRLSI